MPRSTGVTESEPKLATRAIPLPPVPPGATATASGSRPTPRERITSWVAGSTSESVSAPWATTSSLASPGVYASAEGRLSTTTCASARPWLRSTGVTPEPGSVTDAPVVTQATSVADVPPPAEEQPARAGAAAARATAMTARVRNGSRVSRGRMRPRPVAPPRSTHGRRPRARSRP